ncbi:unnamed protein product [Mytilus coruscus]|uniref:Reverse transcriptase/retrotransposon-derived protein RNase H-like domain-containing protein n=1 Tax=Mytilus coruscus TaxID=42192 RepID=A0A6J8DI03_MYTCO|nr:unnamed protein product [Mytilus coruscus]
METPRIIRRSSTRAPRSVEVRQDNCRSRLFSPADSGVEVSPFPMTPLDAHPGKKAGDPSFRKFMHSSPRSYQSTEVVGAVNGLETKCSWGWFWSVWICLLVVCSGCVILVWVYFPENKVVRRSQEYVMTVFFMIIGLLVSTVGIKIVWRSSKNGERHMSDLMYAEDGIFPDINGDQCVKENRDQPCDREDCTIGASIPLFRQSKPSQCADGAEMVVNANDVAERERCVPSLVSHRDASAPSYMAASIPRSGSSHQPEYPIRRTFSAVNEDVWNEFLQYFENIAELNSWDPEKSRRVLLSTLRGQAETFAYGLPLVFQRDYTKLRQKMEERFGNTAMKEKYIAEAKMRRRRDKESLRDFGQALEDLCRRAYPGNPDIVEENAVKAFLDKCGQSEDFRLAVKRTRPKNLQEAVINAMQEECLRVGEKDLVKDKPVNRPIYEVRHRDNMMIDASEPPRAGSTEQTNDYEYNRGVSRGRYNWNNTGRGSRGRPFNRGFMRGRGGAPQFGRSQIDHGGGQQEPAPLSVGAEPSPRPNKEVDVRVKRRWRKRRKVKFKEDSEVIVKETSSSDGHAVETSRETGTPIDSPSPKVKVKGIANMVVKGQIEGTTVEWKIDTGAMSTFITNDTFDLILDKPMLSPVDSHFVAANGQPLRCLGKAEMMITFGENVFEHEVIVGGVRNNLIGEDFISTHRCTWDHDESSFVIKGKRIPLEGSKETKSRRVIALETVMVPPRHEAVIKSGLTNKAKYRSASSSLGILTPERPFLERLGLALAKTLVDSADGVVYTRVYNPGSSDVIVYRHTHLALFTPVCRVGPVIDMNEMSNICEVEVDASRSTGNIPEHLRPMFEIGCRNLDEKQVELFKNFLGANQECFAQPGEVGRTNMGTHKIKLRDDKPISEPPRRIPMYKRQALEDEVKKLEQKGLIEKSESPWSSQVVMVQKKDGWVKTDPAKVVAVKNMKRPETVTQVRSFLGLASYYRKYVKDFSKIAKPLFDLTKKNQKFAWNKDAEAAFLGLKSRLISAPILGFPQADGSEFILDTDASAYAIGAVLSQIQDGKRE